MVIDNSQPCDSKVYLYDQFGNKFSGKLNKIDKVIETALTAYQRWYRGYKRVLDDPNIYYDRTVRFYHISRKEK